MYSIKQIADIVNGEVNALVANDAIAHLIYDSRRVQQPATTLFFALITASNNGHHFIQELIKKGVRNFIVSEPIVADGCNVILVPDTLIALQSLATYHRKQFHYPVIGITGSNGKTIVKEWLFQLLQDDFSIVRSPKSFNSQIGVPLSVWEMGEQHNLAIIEAGISQMGEMEKLEKIIQPTIGVLTNIGEAHSDGFSSLEEKKKEKLKLFKKVKIIIGEDKWLTGMANTFTWGYKASNALQVILVDKQQTTSKIELVYQQKNINISLPFTDDGSIENAINCCCVALYLGIAVEKLPERFLRLHAVDMRLQLYRGINNCLLINDSYSADPTSLKIALTFLQQQSSGLKRTVILSDFFESGKPEKILYEEIKSLLQLYKINRLIAIGNTITKEIIAEANELIIQAYASTEEFIQSFRSSQFQSEIILIKGARRAGFERIAVLFQQKLHGTVLQINLSALAHNIREYQKKLHAGTKMMAMVKAFSYGSGGAEIASVLQFWNVSYLGVAYADEGVELVKAGISLPIMVMNAEQASFAAIIEYNLQPVLYSFSLLHQFEDYIKEQGLKACPVHLEIETGMNRLGFAEADIEAAGIHLASSPWLHLQSVFSHLAASEEPAQDEFTKLQASRFENAVTILKQHITTPFLKHIANSAAIIRHPLLQMDMVRLGIGLYGIEADVENILDLQPVATLRSTIAQVKKVKAGESVSYNRRGKVSRDSVIATVRIGYADGYSRKLGNGVGKMLVHGKQTPVIGTVCMDMTMLDVTDLPQVKEGDEVIVFGEDLSVQQIAQWAGTIPYEIMTSVSQRVKRVYFGE